MKKAIWLLLLALLLACGPSTTTTQPTDTDAEEDTAVSNTETNDGLSQSEGENSTTAATNLDNFSPAGTLPEAAVVREQDWRKGAVDPAVVIIEYGDFQ